MLSRTIFENARSSFLRAASFVAYDNIKLYQRVKLRITSGNLCGCMVSFETATHKKLLDTYMARIFDLRVNLAADGFLTEQLELVGLRASLTDLGVTLETAAAARFPISGSGSAGKGVK